MSTRDPRKLTRRSVLKWGAAAAAVPAVAGSARLSLALNESGAQRSARALAQQVPYPELEEITVAELRSVLDKAPVGPTRGPIAAPRSRSAPTRDGHCRRLLARQRPAAPH